MAIHQNELRCFSFSLLLLLVFSIFTNIGVCLVQSDSFVLEAEQHWDTYGVGGTCISGTHNLALSDVDNDGEVEIVTGGFSYTRGSLTVESFSAPLRIWGWNGQNLTLEKGENWLGSIGCILAGDPDGDGIVEILTSGRLSDDSDGVYALRMWSWNGQDLFLRGSYSGVSANSLFMADVDQDGISEILTVGRASASPASAQLGVWSWDGESFTLKRSVEWDGAGGGARANSVYAADLDNDNVVEIVTCGYVNSLNNSTGQLCVWQFNGEDLSLEASEEWRMVDGYSLDNAGNVMGNTMAHTVKVADVDGDGYAEIVTGGFTYDEEKVNGQLRIWNWTGGLLSLETSREWTTSDITELKGISINDVDGDGKTEIVTSGSFAGYGSFAQGAADKAQAQLRVWSWDGHALTLKEGKDWIVGEAVCAWNVGTSDLDNDGKTEIVTVGCMQVENTSDCDPDLRILSLPASSTPFSFPYLPVAIIAAAIVVVMATFVLLRKSRLSDRHRVRTRRSTRL
jgi:hypothetical protein